MESIVKLLLGRQADPLAGMPRPDARAEVDLAEQARRAGQWCATTPGRGIIPLSRLTAYVLGMS